MMSYKFARRSFLRGVGGAVGLKIMLRNLEASAQGTPSPPRLLITHWPVGTVQSDFIPKTSTNPAIPSNVNSPILMPFATAGLGGDVTVMFGLNTNRLPLNGGGGHEGGTVVMMTGIGAPGTRAGETEGDDAFAGGPSIEQVLLKNVPSLQMKGNKAANGFENAICDSRVDFAEISTQCLSYGYGTTAVTPFSGTVRTQAIPQLPTLRPLDLFTNLFGSFVPPTGGGPSADVIKALKERKSVLDFALRELNQLSTLAPASERNKIDIHAQAIRDIETQISMQLQGTGGPAMGCTMAPMMPPAVSGGAADKADHNNYGNPAATVADDTLHAQIGGLHMGVLKAAFVCDIIRVATFQWSPGTNHVAFKGQFPGEAATIYQHHPLSHRIGSADTYVTGTGRRPEVGFLTNVQTWYNTQMATILAGWKTTTDAMGGNLLDHTVIPFVTEVAATGHEHTNMPAMLFGGKALGFQHGQYIGPATPPGAATSTALNRPLNDLWLTLAQAFGLSTGAAPLNAEALVRNTAGWTGPIPGLWTAP